jgi:signal transduction histidine kinase
VNKDLDSFVYSASHDLRAPLLSMLGLLDVINRHVHVDAQTAGYLGMMRGVILRLDDTIKDILSYSKNSRIEVVNTPIQLKPMVDSVFQGVRNFLTRDIRLEFDIVGDYEFYSDEVRMKSLLNNLISNAIKYSRECDEGSRVIVSANISKDQCTLVVEDNGEGIPYDKQTKVFDMFYRASKNSQGSGLGLYICLEIVKKLGGHIALQSEPGQGTKFTLTLPNHTPQE